MATLRESLTYEPVELEFGTSGLRGLATNMTDLECYSDTAGFLEFVAKQQKVAPNETILVAGDLRESTSRIVASVIQAIHDSGFVAEYHGLIPTPALAYYALERDVPCIMVTGSHIPADRNGIKFYKKGGEVLKSDEVPIHQSVSAVRNRVYESDSEGSLFYVDGSLRNPPELPSADSRAEDAYRRRYLDAFSTDCIAGKKIIFYQHSAVGRDVLVDMLKQLGANVIAVGRSDVFIPLDNENITAKENTYFKQLSIDYPDAFAIISTDGDSDRPFVIDELGEFHRGDVLGVVTAEWSHADYAAYPVSSSDAVDKELNHLKIPFSHTRIGSPFVIAAMQEAEVHGKTRVVGWEVNGGFMLGTSLQLEQGILKALPTRDAFFPILVALLSAHKLHLSVSELFHRLPRRFTDAGLIDNFPNAISKAIVSHFSENTPERYTELADYFSPDKKFGVIKKINTVDGVRIEFDNGDIAHIRPSNNAPQLRIYSVADSPERAKEIVVFALAEPNGIFRQMQKKIEAIIKNG